MLGSDRHAGRYLGLLFFFIFFGSVLVLQMFNLQILKYDFYVSKALANQQGYKELIPRRGEIYIKDYHSQNDFRVATNTTLDTVFADPSMVNDAVFVGEKIAPLLFDEDLALRGEEVRLKELRATLPPELEEEEIFDILKPRSVEVLKQEFRDDLITKISQKVRPRILLYQNPSEVVREKVRAMGLSGVEITDKDIYVYPPEVSDPASHARLMAGVVGIEEKRLTSLLEGKNRYVVLASKIEPSVSEELRRMIRSDKTKFRGIGFEQKTYRFYPENSLASQVLGFMDSAGVGQYGIEAHFNDLLAGKRGVLKTKLDGLGRQITVGDDNIIELAEDGANVYLSIDRSIQMETEKLLKRYVEDTRSDAGQVLVMDPKTGKFMAVAQYPTFDPNEFWKALDTEELFLDEEELDKVMSTVVGGNETTYLVYDEKTDDKLQLLPVRSETTGEVYYEKFKNNVGAAVYRNRVVQDLYEPGSVFKAITMSAAIDTDAVTPQTTMNDNTPVKVDEFIIGNAMGAHYGVVTMTQVLEFSINTGMAWVGQKIGRNLFHSYMQKYGLGKRTGIEFDNEQSGKIRPFTTWADSELATHAFGQGFTVTPVQMITAVSVLANGGILMKPSVVDKIEYDDGKVEEYSPKIVRRVISEKTANTLVAMLVSVVERGQSTAAQIPGYTVAGKTGTSQTYKNGRPLSGAGTTIGTFAGIVPANDPRFVVLVKLDKPRSNQWADSTALPLFTELSEFLVQYLGVVPDK